MSKVDWSLAPHDATHHGQGEDCGYWAKSIGNQQYFINIARWDNGKWKEVSERYDEAFLTARPKPTWSGPQDGLPPVGMKIEYKLPSWSCWVPVTILAYGETRLFVKEDGEPNERTVNAHGMLYRAILTEEQLAAEQRETAIREIMDIADVDCRVTAARLVDAGFKREVV
jgi:hypothetical protein